MIDKTARIALCASLMAGVQFLAAPLAFAQDAETQTATYAALLDEIANLELVTAQRELMLQSQQEKIARMEMQVVQAPQTIASIKGIATKMTAEIEKQIEQDVPFRAEERYARLASLLNMVNDANALPSEMYRRAMTVLDIEVNYGNSVSAYTGDNPVNPGRRLQACLADIESQVCNLSKDSRSKIDAGATVEDLSDEIKDGNYVHFGRMSLIYLDLDSSEGYRWNQETKDWDRLPSGDIINARRAVRIARGESAPGVVTAPIKVQAAQ